MSDAGELSMLDLFRMEAEEQVRTLTSGLLALERDGAVPEHLESCMRAAHSLKGAARIVGLDAGVRLAHVMEDCFVAAQAKRLTLEQEQIDALLAGGDLLSRIATTAEEQLDRWNDDAVSGVGSCVSAIAAAITRAASSAPAPAPVSAPVPPAPPVVDARPARETPDGTDRVLRVTATHLNRLLGLASESLIESRWVKPFSASLLQLNRLQKESCTAVEQLRDLIPPGTLDERAQDVLTRALRTADACHQLLGQRLAELDTFDGRSQSLSTRLYDAALACRMRPFADGTGPYPRMVRDVAHALGKQVRLVVAGESTPVDRDVLARLEAPLGHLLRNAIDHGIETPAARLAAGKPEDGTIRLEARHASGALQVIVADDGAGIDIEKVRTAVVRRQLLEAGAAAVLSDTELLEFLFLPGFSVKDTVTDVSGRGVGLDVVQDMVKQLRGVVRISSKRGEGTRFVLNLPVTLSVVRSLLVEIGGEPYAFPLAHIARTLRLPAEGIERTEGRQHFDVEGRRVGLVTAAEVLGVPEPPAAADFAVVVLGDHDKTYGLVVDRLLGERELVVQPLDPQLGKVKDIAAGALMENGAPVLIVDTDDLLRSMERMVSEGRRIGAGAAGIVPEVRRRKRVLVVDDSLTVRELERKLLAGRGYDVEVAVDGMDGWNAARTGDFDLVVTDIDMPRMDGIELTQRITSDPSLGARPVMVVSYKDRDEDRRRGLEAGAAYYLTKGSFQDDTLIQAVVDLIGEAVA